MIGKIAAWMFFIIFAVLGVGVIYVGSTYPVIALFLPFLSGIFGVLALVFLIIAVILTIKG